MLYKGNFCAECGEKIETESFRWLNRFLCEKCGAVRGGGHLFAPAALLITLFGGGFFLGNIGQPPKTPPLAPLNSPANVVVANANAPATTKPAAQNIAPPNQIAVAKTAANLAVRELPSVSSAKTSPPLNQMPEVNQASYYCGAKTQKGTPCLRKVKGGWRCWQHSGKPAMFPPEKLLIKP